MAENLERVPLGAEEEELVSGGHLTYLYDPKGYTIFDPKNPSQKYTFTRNYDQNTINDIKIRDKMMIYEGKTNADVIATFLTENIITPK